jgi:hypothetical protein
LDRNSFAKRNETRVSKLLLDSDEFFSSQGVVFLKNIIKLLQIGCTVSDWLQQSKLPTIHLVLVADFWVKSEIDLIQGCNMFENLKHTYLEFFEDKFTPTLSKCPATFIACFLNPTTRHLIWNNSDWKEFSQKVILSEIESIFPSDYNIIRNSPRKKIPTTTLFGKRTNPLLPTITIKEETIYELELRMYVEMGWTDKEEDLYLKNCKNIEEINEVDR